MDYFYEQTKHYKGDSKRPLHGIFPEDFKSKNRIIKKVKPLVIDKEFEDKLTITIKNLASYYNSQEELRPPIFQNRCEARRLLHEELLALFRNMRGERHFLQRAPRALRRTPIIPRRLPPNEPKGFVHEEQIKGIFDSMGVNYTEDEALIFRETHYFRVDLKTSGVFIHFTDDEEKFASICLQPTNPGWSNAGLTSYELSLLSKITSILHDELPDAIKVQIRNFITNEQSGPNLSLRYGDNHPIANLRDEMLRELSRLREIMGGRNETDNQREVVPREPRERPIGFSLRAQLQNELRSLFRVMRNEN